MNTQRSIISLIFLLIMQALLACSPLSHATQPAPAKSPGTVMGEGAGKGMADYLVIISIDACRSDYFDFAEVPNIKALMKEGVTYTNAWVGQLRNNTPPGHTSISTGSFPVHNGILCFGWRDPLNNNGQLPTSWRNVTSGFMTNIIARSGATSIGTLYKRAYPEAKVAAVSSDKFYAAAGLGAESADFVLFSKSGDAADYAHTAKDRLEPASIQGKDAGPQIMNDPELRRVKSGKWDSDTWAMDISLKLFHQEKPRIMLINLPDTDEAGHFTGGINNPAAMSKVVSMADRQVGRILEAYKQAGIYDRTVFIVTSDHGMTPTEHTIGQSRINEIVAKAGTRGTEQNEFYLWAPEKAAEVAEGIAAAGLPGIHGAYYSTRAGNGTVYLPSATTATKITGDLDRCFRYLTSTYASSKSPDVLLVIAENWRQDYKVFGLWVMPGSHDTITWLTQHVPLVIAGPGVKKGITLASPARLVDIAPTALALMGVAPEHMDGIVLADALATPAPALKSAQDKVNGDLLPLVNALKKQSDSDLIGGACE